MFEAAEVLSSLMSAEYPTNVGKDGGDDPPPYSGWNESVVHPPPQEQSHYPSLYPPIVVESSFKAEEKRKFYRCVYKLRVT